MTVLRFMGDVQAPPESCHMSCEPENALAFLLDVLEVDYGEILTGQIALPGDATYSLLGVGALASLRFLALSVVEGQSNDVGVLIGAPPRLTGSAGVFPLAAGGTLEFELVTYGAGSVTTRYTVSAVLELADTAAQVAARINAAAALEGFPGVLATVVGGQIRLSGDRPGALEAIVITQEFAGAGFPDDVTQLGSGSELLVDRVHVVSFGTAANQSGGNVWVRGGPATIRYVAAGD
jgi:hypothetical protein